MCVILVPTKRHPTPDELNDAQDSNPHGAGIAWKNQDGKLAYEKAIDAKRVWEIIETEQRSDRECIILMQRASKKQSPKKIMATFFFT